MARVGRTESEKGAVDLMLNFLITMDIKFFYDPDNHKECDVFDDMRSSCKDNAARTLISLVLKAV